MLQDTSQTFAAYESFGMDPVRGQYSLENVLNSPGLDALSDLTVTCQGENFKVHKIVLAANSDYFAAYSRHQWLETEAGVIDLSMDCKPDVLEVVLRFVYGGTKAYSDAWRPFEKAHKLIDVTTAADRFGIKGLAEAATYELVGGSMFATIEHWTHLCRHVYESDRPVKPKETMKKALVDDFINYMTENLEVDFVRSLLETLPDLLFRIAVALRDKKTFLNNDHGSCLGWSYWPREFGMPGVCIECGQDATTVTTEEVTNPSEVIKVRCSNRRCYKYGLEWEVSGGPPLKLAYCIWCGEQTLDDEGGLP